MRCENADNENADNENADNENADKMGVIYNHSHFVVY